MNRRGFLAAVTGCTVAKPSIPVTHTFGRSSCWIYKHLSFNQRCDIKLLPPTAFEIAITKELALIEEKIAAAMQEVRSRGV